MTSKYSGPKGEFAHSSAAIAALINTMPPLDSSRRNSRTALMGKAISSGSRHSPQSREAHAMRLRGEWYPKKANAKEISTKNGALQKNP
jgi:hypothetical protein